MAAEEKKAGNKSEDEGQDVKTTPVQKARPAYEKAQEEWDWCQAVCLWAFRFPWPAQTYQDYFTFVSADFVPKPIYLEVQRYARGE